MPSAIARSSLRPLAAATLLAAASAPVLAVGPTLTANGYEIAVDAKAQAGGAYGGYFYNFNGTPGSTVDQRTGASVTGTNDTTGAARSVVASVQAAPADSPSVANGLVAVNLQDASMRFNGAGRPMGADFSYSQAFMSFTDHVTFNVAGAAADTLTSFHVQVHLDGTLAETGDRDRFNNLPFASMELGFQVGGGPFVNASTGRAHTLMSGATGGAFTLVYADNGTFGADGGWTVVSNPDTLVWDALITVRGAQTTLPFSMSMLVQCQEGASCDYGHTSRFAFDGLPSAVSYTSASGVFLTTPAVPEPSTYALMALGLGALTTVVRRRRAAGEGLLQRTHERCAEPDPRA